MKIIKYGMKTLQIKFDPNAKRSFSRAVSYNTFSIVGFIFIFNPFQSHLEIYSRLPSF